MTIRPGIFFGFFIAASLALMLAAGMALFTPRGVAAPVPDKDQDRIGAPSPAPSSPLLKGAPDLLSPDAPPPANDDEGVGGAAPSYDDLIEDVPDIEAVELTMDKARKALDAFAAIHGKYDDKGIENYQTLQEFADKTEAGKKMQEEIRAFGFKNIAEWNLIIMNIGFAYSSILEGSDETIKAEIRALRNDTKIAPDKREKMLKNLRALIPSDNNRKIVKQLMDDPGYAEKLGLLNEEE